MSYGATDYPMNQLLGNSNQPISSEAQQGS